MKKYEQLETKDHLCILAWNTFEQELSVSLCVNLAIMLQLEQSTNPIHTVNHLLIDELIGHN